MIADSYYRMRMISSCMRNCLTFLKVTAGVFILGSCAAPLIVPADQDAERARGRWSESGITSLQQGHKLYINKCGSCHFLYRPYQYSEQEWMKFIPDMREKARLTQDEFDLIVRYVITMSPVQPEARKKK